MKASCLFKYLKFNVRLQTRWIHPKAKFKLKEGIEEMILNEKIKPRRHPGIIKSSMIELPEWTLEGMRQSLDDVERVQVYKESQQFANYLFSRRLPPEDHDVKNKYSEVENKLLLRKMKNKQDFTENDIEDARKIIKGRVTVLAKSQLYAWKALEYNEHRSLLYMVARSAAEYAVLFKIFQEIKIRDPDFVPQTMFDFGSGVGSALWAFQTHWKRSLTEYLGIDISSDMLDLSEKIMKHSPHKIKSHFYKQYLPFSNLRYDIVISAYSLMDMPDMKSRLKVVAKLWKKTNKYLIIVEQGTNAGFQAVSEARSFVDHVMKNLETKTDYFIFAPCPHEHPCPKHSNFDTPCNFLVHHATLPLLGPTRSKPELYTYIVFKKGSKRTDDDSWHRLVRPTIIRSKCARCRTCTPDGKLEEIIFTPIKYGLPCYRCARSSKWGDRLPIDPIKSQSTEENVSAESLENLEESESEEMSDSDESEGETDFMEEPEIKNEAEIPKEDIFVSKGPFEK